MKHEQTYMSLANFMAYLKYKDCIVVEETRTQLGYENSNEPDKYCLVFKYDPIESITMYHVCSALGIDMPEEHRELQDKLGVIK